MGKCGVTCGGGTVGVTTLCGSSCVDTQTDPAAAARAATPLPPRARSARWARAA